MDPAAAPPPVPSAAARSAAERLTFFEFVGWSIIYVVVNVVADGIGTALVPKIDPLLPTVVPDVYAAVHDDLLKNAGYVLALIVWLVIAAAILKWGDGARRFGVMWAFAAMSGLRAVHALLLVALCPGLLTGTVTTLRWSTRDAYESAHLDYWSMGLVLAAMFLVVEIWGRLRQRRVA